MKVEKVAKYKMNTLKYGGKETGRVFAIQSKLLQSNYKDQPFGTPLFLWSAILSVLKREILGQEIDPLDIIQVLVNDYDDQETEIIEPDRRIHYPQRHPEGPVRPAGTALHRQRQHCRGVHRCVPLA